MGCKDDEDGDEGKREREGRLGGWGGESRTLGWPRAHPEGARGPKREHEEEKDEEKGEEDDETTTSEREPGEKEEKNGEEDEDDDN